MSFFSFQIESKELAKRAKVNTIPGFPDVIRDAAHAAEVGKPLALPSPISQNLLLKHLRSFSK